MSDTTNPDTVAMQFMLHTGVWTENGDIEIHGVSIVLEVEGVSITFDSHEAWTDASTASAAAHAIHGMLTKGKFLRDLEVVNAD